jgi:hypothetical protein
MIVRTKPSQGLAGKVKTMGETSNCCTSSGKWVRQPTLRASVKVKNINDDCTNAIGYYLTKSITGLADGDTLPIDGNGSNYGVQPMMEGNSNDVRIFISGLYQINVDFLFEALGLTDATINISVNGIQNGIITNTGADKVRVNGQYHILLNA